MQAIIISCLICLQISNPCDLTQLNAFTQDPSCEKCLTDLRGHFDLPSDTKNSTLSAQQSCESKTLLETTRILQGLVSNAEDFAQNLNLNPNEVYDLINKVGTEIRQEAQIQRDNKPEQRAHNEVLERQEQLLAKISEKFKSLFHHVDDIVSKLSAMKKLLSSNEVKEVEEDDNDEEHGEEKRKRRDSIKPGERLMAGKYLESMNGEYKFVLSATDGKSYIYYRNGTVKTHEVSCEFPTPIPPKLHMFMNHTLEYYLDIWHGKSANLRCLTVLPMQCVPEHADCFVKLDNDGHLKYFTQTGEPVLTLL